jgi:hypothetical protein
MAGHLCDSHDIWSSDHLTYALAIGAKPSVNSKSAYSLAITPVGLAIKLLFEDFGSGSAQIAFSARWG